ncbi:helical backbone metal receptor [Chitinophaga sp. XS-30]|uniref:helical backbone metal receptor n=1 Tax=Chitinophaga sp. XS-30 TaxID=2604421 RepID=UPI0011DD7F90|nr:helical backbone metal receptor [Chitinophaga sp. XS-30]QEH42625.1 ABC transporter substrate-binding protein [Chitinophaga sp. XS-30]
MLFTDQLGRSVEIPSPPRRIVSVVPSQTELLYDLGVSVTGITKFCVHPESWFRSITRIGGTKQLNIEKIISLQPDLIIANKEENEKAQIEALAAKFPVWISDIQNLGDACNMILSLGNILQKTSEALSITSRIKEGFARLQPPSLAIPAAYFIWRNPWMIAGGDTFIHEMMHACGFRNVFEDMPRYPVISLAQLAASGCRLVLLSSEPYPFCEKHIAEVREYLPDADIRLVDGEMFSWYGSRLLHAPEYFRELMVSLQH